MEGRETRVLSACGGSPGQAGLEGSTSCPAGAHVAAVCVALRCDRCSFSKYFLSTCCVVSRVQARGTAVSRADPGVCLHRAYPLGQRWTSPQAPGNTGCICDGRGMCPCSQGPVRSSPREVTEGVLPAPPPPPSPPCLLRCLPLVKPTWMPDAGSMLMKCSGPGHRPGESGGNLAQCRGES